MPCLCYVWICTLLIYTCSHVRLGLRSVPSLTKYQICTFLFLDPHKYIFCTQESMANELAIVILHKVYIICGRSRNIYSVLVKYVYIFYILDLLGLWSRKLSNPRDQYFNFEFRLVFWGFVLTNTYLIWTHLLDYFNEFSAFSVSMFRTSYI